jgi:hypothetical protein
VIRAGEVGIGAIWRNSGDQALLQNSAGRGDLCHDADRFDYGVNFAQTALIRLGTQSLATT